MWQFSTFWLKGDYIKLKIHTSWLDIFNQSNGGGLHKIKVRFLLIMTPLHKNPINLILVYPQNRITCRMVLHLIYSLTFHDVLRVVAKWLDNNGCTISWESLETCLRTDNSVKRSDVTGNPFEWLLGEIRLYKSCSPYFSILASSVIGGQGYWVSQNSCVLY